MAAFPLRLPDELKVWIASEADRLDRSQNGVLVRLVRKAKHAAEAAQPQTGGRTVAKQETPAGRSSTSGETEDDRR